MKGIVFNILHQLIEREHGEDVWDELLEETELEGAYTSLGSYADEQFYLLVRSASARLGISSDDLIRYFGRNALPMFAARYPKLFEAHTTARTFVLTLNDIIHPEVRKLYPGADVPEFDFDARGDVLIMGYQSPRRLCAFAEGLLHGSADHYHERLSIEQPRCMNRGDDRCVLEITFTE